MHDILRYVTNKQMLECQQLSYVSPGYTLIYTRAAKLVVCHVLVLMWFVVWYY